MANPESRRIKLLENELKEKKDEVNELKAQLQKERDSKGGEQLPMTNGYPPGRPVNHEDEVSKLKDQVKKLEVEIERMNKEIETLKKENINLKTQIEDAEMEADTLREERRDWESKNDRLEEKLSHHTNKFAIVMKKIEQLEKSEIEGQKEIKQLKEGKTEADKKIKELEEDRLEDRLEAERKMKRMQERIDDMAVDTNLIYIAQIAYNFARQVYYIVLGKDLYKEYDPLYYMTDLEGIVRDLEDNNHPNCTSISEEWDKMKARLKWKPQMADYLKQLREMRIWAAHPVRLYKSKALEAIDELKKQNILDGPICETMLEVVRVWQITCNRVPNKLK